MSNAFVFSDLSYISVKAGASGVGLYDFKAIQMICWSFFSVKKRLEGRKAGSKTSREGLFRLSMLKVGKTIFDWSEQPEILIFEARAWLLLERLQPLV